MKELELIKLKTLNFVKTYETEFRKMKHKMRELEIENMTLKQKLN